MNLGANIGYFGIKFWTAWLQHRVAGGDVSHWSIYTGVNELGRREEFEANLIVDTTTLILTKNKTRVYERLDVSYDDMKKLLNELIDENEEKMYDFLAWLAVPIRVIAEKIGFKKAKSWHIFWDFGVQCSALLWKKLKKENAVATIPYKSIDEYLDEFNPRMFTAYDAYLFFQKFWFVYANTF